MRKRLKATTVLLSFVFISQLFLLAPFSTPKTSAVSTGGIDTNPPPCSGLGIDIDQNDRSNFTKFIPSDFKIEIITRTKIRISAANPGKHFFTTGSGPTLGEILGAEGCIIDDAELDGTFSLEVPAEMFSIDQIKMTSGARSFSEQVRTSSTALLRTISIDGLGPINIGEVESFELTWAIRTKDQYGSDEFVVLKTPDKSNPSITSWDDVQSQSVDNQTGLIITNITNKENLNIYLMTQGSEDDLSIVTSDQNNAFSQGQVNGETVFLVNPADPNQGYLAFTDNKTARDLYSATGTVDMEFRYGQDDPAPYAVKVLGFAGTENLQRNNPSINLVGINAGSDIDTCESKSGAFSFVMCPLLRGIDGAFGWLDEKIANALLVSEDYYRDPQIKNAWARVRNISFILLIPVILVMVIGTALGFSFLDAYTVKRAMPRLLAAAVFIGLSYNLCIMAIEVTNALGRGIGGIIAQPFGGTESLTLSAIFPNFGDASNWGVAGILAGISWKFASTQAITGIIGATIGPLVVILVIIYMLLAVRELLIIFALIFAPLAILSWIFPGNDKLWKLWWNTFSKMLYIFPIIMALMMVGRGFAHMVNIATDSSGVTNIIIKAVAFVGPYFFIPKAFTLAGGAFANLAGMANDRSRGIFDRAKKKRGEIVGRRKEHLGRRVVQRRADWQNRLQSAASNEGYGRGRRKALSMAAGAVGGYNIQADDAARRSSVSKELNEQIAAGRDDEIRGLTVNKKAAEKAGELIRQADGSQIQAGLAEADRLFRITKEGQRQYRTLGGAWVDEDAVDAGYKRWGSDSYAQQAALSYEMRKASSEEDVARIRDNYAQVATGPGGWGQTDNQAGGTWIGAAFENQNQHLEFKHTRWRNGEMFDRRDDGTISDVGSARSFVEEIYEKKGSYQVGQYHSSTIKRLTAAYDAAEQVMADPRSTAEQRQKAYETQERVKAVAETFVQRGISGGQQLGAAGEGDTKTPIFLPPSAAQGQGSSAQTYVPGASHVAERVNELANRVGVMDRPPVNPHGDAYSEQKGRPAAGPPAP